MRTMIKKKDSRSQEMKIDIAFKSLMIVVDRKAKSRKEFLGHEILAFLKHDKG